MRVLGTRAFSVSVRVRPGANFLIIKFMILNTRLSQVYERIKGPIQKRIFNFKSKFTQILFCLLIGFLIGNIFGTFLTFFRSIFFWDGFIVFLVLILFEFINFLIYIKPTNPFYFSKFFLQLKNKNFYYILNNFKG